jgi:hypothetical protein
MYNVQKDSFSHQLYYNRYHLVRKPVPVQNWCHRFQYRCLAAYSMANFKILLFPFTRRTLKTYCFIYQSKKSTTLIKLPLNTLDLLENLAKMFSIYKFVTAASLAAFSCHHWAQPGPHRTWATASPPGGHNSNFSHATGGTTATSHMQQHSNNSNIRLPRTRGSQGDRSQISRWRRRTVQSAVLPTPGKFIRRPSSVKFAI